MAKKTAWYDLSISVGFKIPMAAPSDIGEFAAKLMMEPVTKTGLHYVEGPEPYSPAEVAEAFGECCKNAWKQLKLLNHSGFRRSKKWVFLTRLQWRWPT